MSYVQTEFVSWWNMCNVLLSNTVYSDDLFNSHSGYDGYGDVLVTVQIHVVTENQRRISVDLLHAKFTTLYF